MDNIAAFFKYFIKTTPGTEFKYQLPVIIVAVLLLVAASLFSVYYKKKKKTDFAFKRLFAQLSKRMITIGLFLLIYTAVRYENIPFFSMRLWLYLIVLLALFFTYRYIKIFKIDYKREKHNIEQKLHIHKEKKQEHRYLATKKRK